MSVRELLYQLVANDPELNTLGFTPDTVYANGAPDSPMERRWAVIVWGIENPGIATQIGRGRMSDREVELWVYDRDRDYTTINSVLARWRELMDDLASVRTGAAPTDGWVTSAFWSGDGRDGYDGVYEAVYRTSAYRLIASGD